MIADLEVMLMLQLLLTLAQNPMLRSARKITDLTLPKSFVTCQPFELCNKILRYDAIRIWRKQRKPNLKRPDRNSNFTIEGNSSRTLFYPTHHPPPHSVNPPATGGNG